MRNVTSSPWSGPRGGRPSPQVERGCIDIAFAGLATPEAIANPEAATMNWRLVRPRTCQTLGSRYSLLAFPLLMDRWTEAILALAVTALVGVSLMLSTGESLIGSGATTSTTINIEVDDESASRGMVLADSNGCLACHTIDGTPSTGPTWKGVAGSSRPLETGESVVADDLYLFRSITDPGSQVVAGFDNVMPATYGDTLSDQEISDLVEYIKSLG